METTQQQAILFIALRAAFADGGKDERERLRYEDEFVQLKVLTRSATCIFWVTD